MKGELLWLSTGFGLAAIVLASFAVWRGPRGRVVLANCALAIAALTIGITAMELYLRLREAPSAGADVPQTAPVPATPPEPLVIRYGRAEITLPAKLVARMKWRQALLTMPESFQQRQAPSPCPGVLAVYLHDALHLFDQNKFRRCDGPFPEPRSDVFRVAVFGDSLTYGQGVESEWTYSEQLQRLMGKDYRIEFINLGFLGGQSEDILNRMRKVLPLVKPNLVIYGVCLNDFLPSGKGEYDHEWAVPLPAGFKTMMRERTRVGSLVYDGYSKLLLQLGLSMDFIDDILKDFGNYQTRFGHDLVQMQALMRDAGLPPVVGLVLNAFPGDRRWRQLMMDAERWMDAAGFEKIPSADYHRTYSGHPLRVSRWDGHPNEHAHAIFAATFAERLFDRQDLGAYRRQ